MKTKDILILGSVAIAAIFILPKLINLIKGGAGGLIGGAVGSAAGGFLGAGGFKEVIGAGGTVSTTKEAGLPWWTFISPFTTLTAYAQQAAGTGDITQTVTPGIKTKFLKSRPEPFKAKPMTIKGAQRLTSKGYLAAPVKRQKVIERIHADLPKTITTVPGQVSPYFVQILKGKAKYGTTGGR